jgi:hypothetical protein
MIACGDDWYIAFAGARQPTRADIDLALQAIGFVIGEQLAIGILRAVGASGVLGGMARYEFGKRRIRDTREAPALPVSSKPEWVVSFVEKIFQFHADNPKGPHTAAIQHYFGSLTDLLEAQFLHAWIGAETLANWGIEHLRLKSGAKQRIADREAWRAWVKAHESEILGFAVPPNGPDFLNRVRDSDAGRQNDVQLAFLGEGIPWSSEMRDAEAVRNNVMHEGLMLGYRNRDWHLDFSRIGLAVTLLTTLLAKLVGYAGPIADRAKTHNDVTGADAPPWWVPAADPPPVRYANYDNGA